MIRDVHPGGGGVRIPGSKRHRIPDPGSAALGRRKYNIRHFESQYFNNTIVEAEMMFTQRRLERTRVIYSLKELAKFKMQWYPVYCVKIL
jgi:hypothetical protein